MGCASTKEAARDDAPASRPTAGSDGTTSQAPEKKKKKPKSEVRLVLIGQGESGKSTIFKQFKIIQAKDEGLEQGFNPEERAGARGLVYDNIVSQMKVLVKVSFDEDMEYSSDANKALARKLVESPAEHLNTSSPETGQMVKMLWSEEALKVIYGERDRLFNLNDGAGYFWDNIERIYKDDFIPTEDDLLRVRIRTMGFDEAVFNFKDTAFRVVDLGGQRSERRKWEEAIQPAECILFVSSLCEWDQRLREDFSQSRMRETLSLFRELLELPSCESKTVIVLLNKLDLFKEKMQSSRKENFQRFFTDYKGALEWEPCSNHIRQKFSSLAGKRTVFLHCITAVNTDNIKLIWGDIRNALIQQIIMSTMPAL